MKRLLIIVSVAGLVVLGFQAFTRWQGEGETSGQLAFFSTEKLGEKVENLGGMILGKAVGALPNAPQLEEIEKETKQEAEESADQSGEPIAQPVENVREQTESLLETIKELPQEQIEAIKKQIFKEACKRLEECQWEE